MSLMKEFGIPSLAEFDRRTSATDIARWQALAQIEHEEWVQRQADMKAKRTMNEVKSGRRFKR